MSTRCPTCGWVDHDHHTDPELDAVLDCGDAWHEWEPEMDEGWFADHCEDAPGAFPWQPCMILDGICASVDIWFRTEAECVDFIRSTLATADVRAGVLEAAIRRHHKETVAAALRQSVSDEDLWEVGIGRPRGPWPSGGSSAQVQAGTP